MNINENAIEKMFNHEIFGYVLRSGDDLEALNYEQENIDEVNSAMKMVLEKMYEFTKRELKNYFNYNEAFEILNTFISTIYRGDTPPKELLLAEVRDHFIYECPILSEDEQTTLMNKLKSLTEFQCFTIIMICHEYKCGLYEKTIDGIDEIKKIFLIEEWKRKN